MSSRSVQAVARDVLTIAGSHESTAQLKLMVDKQLLTWSYRAPETMKDASEPWQELASILGLHEKEQGIEDPALRALFAGEYESSYLKQYKLESTPLKSTT